MAPVSPFDPDNHDGYARWRDARLAAAPADIGDLVVELRDPRELGEAEHAALLDCLRRCNMAIYAGATGDDPDKAIPRRLGERFGLVKLDSNYLADDDGISSLTVNPAGEHPQYIPYTNRGIRWHTDGYYNTPEHQIRGLILHCVHPAAEGGGNRLLDPEIAYLRLRELEPGFIRALLQPDAMTIPPGRDSEGGERGAAVGPVFRIMADGSLHMRYTARSRNVEWSADPEVQAAKLALEALLDGEEPLVYAGRLESGMGLICNNVLHDRGPFQDREGAPSRLIYRARYFDRVAGTAG